MLGFDKRPSGPAPALYLAAALAPAVTFFASKGVTPLIVVAVVAGLALCLVAGRRPVPLGRPVLAILAMVCLWAALSTGWALDTWFAARGSGKFILNLLLGAGLTALAASLSNAERRGLEIALLAGFAIGLGLLATEWVFSGPILESLRGFHYRTVGSGPYWLKNCQSTLLVLVWPAAFAAWRRWGWGAGAALFLSICVISQGLTYRTGLIAGSVGFAVAFVVYFQPRKAALLLAIALAGAILVMPVIPVTVLQPRTFITEPLKLPKPYLHRLYIWEFAARNIAEHPLRGWGMNASRTMPGGNDRVVDEVYGDHGSTLPLHPHSASLQVWLELGLPGALGFVGVVVLLLRASARINRDRRLAAATAGQLAAVFVMSGMSYSLWSSWWQAVLWLGAALSVAAVRESPPASAAPD